MPDIELPGFRVKIRTTDDDLVATVWVDGQPVVDILRSPLAVIGEPGSDGYHAFVDAASKIFQYSLEPIIKPVTDLPLTVKRRKPDYEEGGP